MEREREEGGLLEEMRVKLQSKVTGALSKLTNSPVSHGSGEDAFQ